jgi:alkaline phosphatase D
MKHFSFILLYIVVQSFLFANELPYVLVVSFDGFRHDYFEKTETPNFDKFAKNGVKAKSLQPVFPSLTFPNHYSIATGAYSGTHMITGNSFYDKKFKEYYSLRDSEKVRNGKFYQSEPIWVTAERQGIKSASYFWVGSEAEINGFRPSIYKHYDGKIPFSTRVDSVISWLQYPKKNRPHLIMLYFSEPDHTGHEDGPNHKNIISTIQEMDNLLGYLMNQLQSIEENIEIQTILLSDHGMSDVSKERIVILDEYIAEIENCYVNGRGALVQLDLKSEISNSSSIVWNQITKIPHLSAYKKDELPEHFHFNNRNTGEFVLVADDGWLIYTKEFVENREITVKGMHGYDPKIMNMHGIFLAQGSKIRKDIEIESFENIHVYPLICNLLEITPYSSEIDGPQGSIDILKPILVHP